MHICLLPYHFQDLLSPLLVRCPCLLGTKKFKEIIFSMPFNTAGLKDPNPTSRKIKNNLFSLEIWFSTFSWKKTQEPFNAKRALLTSVALHWRRLLVTSTSSFRIVIGWSYFAEGNSSQIRKRSPRFGKHQLNRRRKFGSNNSVKPPEIEYRIYKIYAV